MSHLIIFITIILVIIFAVIDKPFIKIIISKGELSLKKGKVTRGLLADFSEVLKGVDDGVITAYRTEQGLKLKSKGDISPAVMQRLRNIIGIHYR